MICTIQIKYGDKEDQKIEISNLSDEEIYGKGNFLVDNLQQNLNKILKNNPDWNTFVEKLIKHMSSTSAVIKDVNYNDIQDSKDLIPNVNAAYIKDMYPDIDFPDVDVPILLLDNLDRSVKNGVQGRVIDTKGNEIFVVKGDKNSIIKLGKYLTIRERTGEEFIGALDGLDSKLSEELEYVFQRVKSTEIPTKTSLLTSYIQNKNKFKNLKKEPGKRSPLSILQDVSKIVSRNLLDQLDNDLAKEFEQVFNYFEKDVKDKKQLLFNFLNNRSKYKDINEQVNGRSYFGILEDVANVISSIPKVNLYSNPLVDELVRRFTYGFNSAKINLGKYYSNILKVEMPNVMKLLDINSADKFIAFINKEGKDVKDLIKKSIEDEKYKDLSDLEKSFVEKIKKDIEQDEEQWITESFFNWMQGLLGPTTTPIRFKPKKLNKNILELESAFPTIKSVYGLGYDTVSKFSEVESLNGYTIYAGTVNKVQAFFISKGILTPESQGIAYHTIEEAKEAIAVKSSKEILKASGLFDLKTRKRNGKLTTREGSTFLSSGFIPSKSIITSIDMVVTVEGMLNNEFLLLDKTFQDFQNYINNLAIGTKTKEIILNNIDTAEKAAIFLSEVNQRMNTLQENGRVTYDRSNESVFEAIVEDIKKAPVKYYYIKNSIQTNTEGQRRYYFIETDKITTQAARTSPRVPIVKFLGTLAAIMQDKFGVPVHVVSNEDIIEATKAETIAELEAIEKRTQAEEAMLTMAKELKGLQFDSTVKAFIHNGEIYINSSTANIQDSFHEYAHLILGVLKSNPKTRNVYVELLKKALNTEYAAQAIERKRKLYPNRSYYDLAEEVFADMYGAYMNKNLPYDISTLFDDSKELKENENVIFNLKDADKPLKEYSGKTMRDFWERFNRDVALTLKDNPSFIKGNGEIQMQRRKANWLAQQIKDGKIEEKCE